MKEHKSQVLLKATEDTQISQNANDFYKLYYRPKNSLQTKRHSISLRARSVNTIVQAKHQQQMPNDLYIRQKRSLIERMKDHQQQKEKIRIERNKNEKLSYQQVLAKQTQPQYIEHYFNQYPNQFEVDLEDYSKKNIAVKLAIQKCKDEKVKIKKIICSNKQSEETKLDYLQLKKKDIEEDIKKQIKLIYDEFFRRQYQSQSSSKGFIQFQHKIRIAMQLMHTRMFGQ